MARGEKKPLWRKVNTRTHGVRHGGGDFRHDRHSKREKAASEQGVVRGKMRSGRQHGRDYTPLFRFLHAKVGLPWADTAQEAQSRLDTSEPIAWLVAEHAADRHWIVRIGESSYWQGLWVDDDGVLQLVAPDLTIDELVPRCSCCTHSFNGERLSQPFPGVPEAISLWNELQARHQPEML